MSEPVAVACRRTRAEHDPIVALGILGEDEPVELFAGQIVQGGCDSMVGRRWRHDGIDRLAAAGPARPEERRALAGGGWLCGEPGGALARPPWTRSRTRVAR